MTQYLWDASDYDWSRGPMDLRAARADGIVGFTHKATEATWIKHAHTGEALARARDAGIEFVGAYHVVRSTDVHAQVDYFLGYLDEVAPWWRTFPGFFHQIDLEIWDYDRVSAATGIAFARALVAAQPKRVIMYASRGMYGDQLAGCPVPLWNASYGTNPAVHYPDAYPGDGSARWNPYSGQTPVLLQYGSTVRIGSQPTCDINAFRGTLAELRTLIIGPQPPPKEEDMPVIIRDSASGAVWVSNYVTRRHVVSGPEWTYLRGAPGVTDLGDLAAGQGIDWFGVDVATLGGSATAPTHDELVQAAREGAELAEDS